MDDPAWSAIHRLVSVVEKMQRVDGLWDTLTGKSDADKVPSDAIDKSATDFFKVEIPPNGPTIGEKRACFEKLTKASKALAAEIKDLTDNYNKAIKQQKAKEKLQK